LARVTSKLQVTIPKAIADLYGIEPGAELTWLPAGEAIRVVTTTGRVPAVDRGRRLDLFDRATERQRSRQAGKETTAAAVDRGWRREDIYAVGQPR
jgi:bifunctional DNA-binding transcriptional regulator/antitoxin component of YhaV-PrlF toxin-antitoxin module